MSPIADGATLFGVVTHSLGTAAIVCVNSYLYSVKRETMWLYSSKINIMTCS